MPDKEEDKRRKDLATGWTDPVTGEWYPVRPPWAGFSEWLAKFNPRRGGGGWIPVPRKGKPVPRTRPLTMGGYNLDSPAEEPTFESVAQAASDQEAYNRFVKKYPIAKGIPIDIVAMLAQLTTDPTGMWLPGDFGAEKERQGRVSMFQVINYFGTPEGQEQFKEWQDDPEGDRTQAMFQAGNFVGRWPDGTPKVVPSFLFEIPVSPQPYEVKHKLDDFDVTSETGRKELAKAVKEGSLTAEEAYGGKLTPRQPGVEVGQEVYPESKEEFTASEDTRSPWVKWQHALAGREQAQQIEQLKEAALQSPDVRDIINRAKKAGIPEETIAEWLPALQMSEVYQDNPSWGAARFQIQNLLARAELAAKFRKQAVLGADYPEEFAAFAKTPGGQPAGWSMGQGIAGATRGFFETWAMNQPALKAKIEAQRASRYAYYPGSTEAYEQATEAGTAFETGPRGEEKPLDFMNWLRANPQFAGEFRRGERSRLGQKAGYAPRTRWI